MAPPIPIPAPEAPHAASLTPNHFQINTVIVACIYLPVSLVAWNLPVVRDMLAGVKLFVVGAHEMFHLAVGVICGGQVRSVCIDPNDGGSTTLVNLMRTEPRVYADPGPMTFGRLYWSAAAVATLSAGYFGSSVLGFCYVFAAFDIVASKVASFTIAVGLLVPIIRADHWIAYASIIASEALLIGLWFGDHGNALRFYVLFVGILHLFYTVWDYIDERVFDKPNTSDCTEFAGMLGWTANIWAVVWFVWESLVFITAIMGGIVAFQKTPEKMYSDAAGFLPT